MLFYCFLYILIYNEEEKERDIMHSFSLSDVTLENLFLNHHLSQYNVQFDMKSTVGDNIYKYLTSNEGFIKHKRHVHYSKEQEHLYRQALRSIVSKGSPITIFFSSFSPKITNPSITNSQFLPDMADLLTLVHLHLLAKHIRSFYDYGFRFIIAFKGTLYQPIMKWSDETVQKTYDILQDLVKHAERITGVRHVVEFVDYMDLVEREGEYFKEQWHREAQHVKNLYHDDDEYIERKITGWIKDYKKSIHIEDFQDIQNVNHFLLEQAFSVRALKHIQFRGGDNNNGICNSLPPTVRTSIRGIDPELSLQINPYFRFHSHQRLLALSAHNEWFSFQWKDEKNMTPVITTEYGYPFYYKAKP